MDKSKDQHGDIDWMLRGVYEGTEPRDSWQALRGRIDATVSGARSAPRLGGQEVVFWRRAALAMAACFIVAVGLLLCVVSTNRRDDPPGAAALLTQTQTDRLVQAFSQVRAVFEGHRPWLLIDSVGTSQMGLTSPEGDVGQEETLIVLRLAVQEVGGQTGHRYADLVTYPRQPVAFSLETAAGSTLELRLVATPREDGQVDIDFVTQGQGDARTGRAVQVGRDAFTSLAPIQAGAHGSNLGVTARSVRLPEKRATL